MPRKQVPVAPFPLANALDTGPLNAAFGQYGSWISGHNHDPGDTGTFGGAGAGIPSFGPSNPLYTGVTGIYPVPSRAHGPNVVGTDWATAFEPNAAIPADVGESSADPTASALAAGWGHEGEDQRQRGAISQMWQGGMPGVGGRSANWFPPSNYQAIAAGTTITQDVTLDSAHTVHSGRFDSTIAPGTAPLSVLSTTPVVNLTANYLVDDLFPTGSGSSNHQPTLYYGTQTYTVTTATRTGAGTAWTGTLTIGTHTLLVGQTIAVSGFVSPYTGYNVASALITAVTGTTISYAITGTDPGSPAAGPNLGTVTYTGAGKIPVYNSLGLLDAVSIGYDPESSAAYSGTTMPALSTTSPITTSGDRLRWVMQGWANAVGTNDWHVPPTSVMTSITIAGTGGTSTTTGSTLTLAGGLGADIELAGTTATITNTGLLSLIPPLSSALTGAVSLAADAGMLVYTGTDGKLHFGISTGALPATTNVLTLSDIMPNLNWVSSGFVATGAGNSLATGVSIGAGVAYFPGQSPTTRYSGSGGTVTGLAATSDIWIDMDNLGNFHLTTQTPGAAEPTLNVNYVRIDKVVTGATTVTSVTALGSPFITNQSIPSASPPSAPNLFGAPNVPTFANEQDIRGHPDMTTAIARIGTTPTTLIVSVPTTVSTNVTIPSNVVLRKTGNGIITVANGVTLTLTNTPQCVHGEQFFQANGPAYGQGSVSITQFGVEIWAEWFGASHIGVTGIIGAGIDSGPAIQAAVNAVPALYSGTIRFAGPSYRTSIQIVVANTTAGGIKQGTRLVGTSGHRGTGATRFYWDGPHPNFLPSTSPSVALPSATVGNKAANTYVYAVSYVRGSDMAESICSPPSHPVFLQTGQTSTDLSFIPVSSDPTVTDRHIYVSRSGTETPLYFVGAIGNNTATTFNDGVDLRAGIANSRQQPIFTNINAGDTTVTLAASAVPTWIIGGAFPSAGTWLTVWDGTNDETFHVTSTAVVGGHAVLTCDHFYSGVNTGTYNASFQHSYAVLPGWVWADPIYNATYTTQVTPKWFRPQAMFALRSWGAGAANMQIWPAQSPNLTTTAPKPLWTAFDCDSPTGPGNTITTQNHVEHVIVQSLGRQGPIFCGAMIGWSSGNNNDYGEYSDFQPYTNWACAYAPTSNGNDLTYQFNRLSQTVPSQHYGIRSRYLNYVAYQSYFSTTQHCSIYQDQPRSTVELHACDTEQCNWLYSSYSPVWSGPTQPANTAKGSNLAIFGGRYTSGYAGKMPVPPIPWITAATGGTELLAGTYAYALTYYNAGGLETQYYQPTFPVTLSSAGRVAVTLPSPSSKILGLQNPNQGPVAAGWRLYRTPVAIITAHTGTSITMSNGDGTAFGNGFTVTVAGVTGTLSAKATGASTSFTVAWSGAAPTIVDGTTTVTASSGGNSWTRVAQIPFSGGATLYVDAIANSATTLPATQPAVYGPIASGPYVPGQDQEYIYQGNAGTIEISGAEFSDGQGYNPGLQIGNSGQFANQLMLSGSTFANTAPARNWRAGKVRAFGCMGLTSAATSTNWPENMVPLPDEFMGSAPVRQNHASGRVALTPLYNLLPNSDLEATGTTVTYYTDPWNNLAGWDTIHRVATGGVTPSVTGNVVTLPVVAQTDHTTLTSGATVSGVNVGYWYNSFVWTSRFYCPTAADSGANVTSNGVVLNFEFMVQPSGDNYNLFLDSRPGAGGVPSQFYRNGQATALGPTTDLRSLLIGGTWYWVTITVTTTGTSTTMSAVVNNDSAGNKGGTTIGTIGPSTSTLLAGAPGGFSVFSSFTPPGALSGDVLMGARLGGPNAGTPTFTITSLANAGPSGWTTVDAGPAPSWFAVTTDTTSPGRSSVLAIHTAANGTYTGAAGAGYGSSASWQPVSAVTLSGSTAFQQGAFAGAQMRLINGPSAAVTWTVAPAGGSATTGTPSNTLSSTAWTTQIIEANPVTWPTSPATATVSYTLGVAAVAAGANPATLYLDNPFYEPTGYAMPTPDPHMMHSWMTPAGGQLAGIQEDGLGIFKGITTFAKAGAISDADWFRPPLDATIAVNTSTNTLMFRSSGAWQSVPSATVGGDLTGTLPNPTLDLTKPHTWTGKQLMSGLQNVTPFGIVPAPAGTGAPTGTHAVGDFYVDNAGALFYCTVAPSTWVQLGSGMVNPLTTTGDIIYSSAGTTAARLGIGAASTVLKGGAAPNWGTIFDAQIDAAAAIAASKLAASATNGQVLTTVSGATAWSAPTGQVLIQTITADGTLGTYTFSSIPATYSRLVIEITGASTAAATSDQVTVLLNGDNGANAYEFENATRTAAGWGSQTFARSTAAQLGYVAGATATAGDAGFVRLVIPEYTSTNWNKVIFGEGAVGITQGAAGSVENTLSVGNWYPTASASFGAVIQAITSITLGLFTGGAHWANHTVLRLYGIL